MTVTDDIVEIMMLKGRYVNAVDERRVDDLVELFTDDATVDPSSRTGEVFGPGRESVRAGYQKWIGSRGASTMHTSMTPLITVDGDAATGRWYALWAGHAERAFAEEHGVVYASGFYDERYARVDGAWKIRSIKISFRFHHDPDVIQTAR